MNETRRSASLRHPVLGAGVVLALVLDGLMTSAAARGREDAMITIQGESPARTNIPTGSDPRASGGAYLNLSTPRTPPRGGWYATYKVNAPAAGAYRVETVSTSPVEQDEEVEDCGSYFNLSVNGARFAQVARSQPQWVGSPHAWGGLYRLRLDDVELRRGTNTITFMVDEPVPVSTSVLHRLLLDAFTLTPTDVALSGVHLVPQDRSPSSTTHGPADNLGIYREGERASLSFRLNARAPAARPVRYEISDYFGAKAGSGTATVPAGGTAVTVPPPPSLPPGNFRVTASLGGTPVVGHFAHLPRRRPVTGAANRFGVNVWAFTIVPPSRLGALLTAMREMGAGYVRDGDSWSATVPARGRYVRTPYDRLTRAFHAHGLKSLETITEPPGWATTPASLPLPVDLRDAHAFARHLAGKAGATRSDAVHVSNEPEADETASTGDQQAAYVKATALGVADGPGRPFTVLPSFYESAHFQDLMLQNQVVGYADYWAMHGYPNEYPDPVNPRFPVEEVEKHHGLRRLYGARTPLWMSEGGTFLRSSPDGLSRTSQTTQARYLVRSTVGALATGTAKHFWFSGSPIGYLNDGGEYFGMLSPGFQPWPSYSAHAAMASILGEANFVAPLRGVPGNVTGHVFAAHGKTVTVLWADKPTQVDVPTPGHKVDVYDIMGAHKGTTTTTGRGTVRLTVSSDPVYLASDAPAPASAAIRGKDVRRAKPSVAEHIVLNQRFAARNAAPNKNSHGENRPPYGYRLDPTTPMTLDVYNFNDTPQTVTVSGRAYGGWSARPATRTTVRVPANGRVGVPFTIASSRTIPRGVDYPLVFEAGLGGRAASPSVSRIQLPAPGEPGAQIPLAPSIANLSPSDGTTVTGPRVNVTADITDALSGIDAARLTLEVDGRPVPTRFDPATGRLTAAPHLTPGRHRIWVRAINKAHAPAQASATVTVRR
ncbi:Ig-like domain-containing protein [Actinomadura rubrisoli]|uniref:Cadherin repeat domain-containing protein n=1 Tax=Actinomadura rubrisoli TaxID=2530368 RepID=A0A4R5APD3_9ACTN|nr:cadherin repeat domain-containing protein [Actinomadura rubrisoli]TDD73529.1 cadherin repeat domain-containing protein [Actinomadura rubrisoli]